jgi:hypothetical protein
MNKIFLVVVTVLSCQSVLAEAGSVPRCWNVGQTPIIQNGLFRVFIPTSNLNALQVAAVIGVLSQSLTSQKGFAVTSTGDRIELDVFGDLQYWTASAAFPTLDSFKDAIVQSITPVLSVAGVSVECAASGRHFPIP